MTLKNILWLAGSALLVASVSLTSAGCSGGGSSGGGGASTNTGGGGGGTTQGSAPVFGAITFTPNPATVGAQVTGSGTVSDQDNDLVSGSLKVTQLPGTTPVMGVSGSVNGNTVSIVFTPANISTSENVQFKLEIVDSKGNKGEATASITVNPQSSGGGGGGGGGGTPPAMTITNISRVGQGKVSTTAEQQVGHATNANLRGTVAYVISGSQFDRYPAERLKVVINGNDNTRLQLIPTSSTTAEFEMPVGITPTAHTMEVVAYINSSSTTRTETATGQMTINEVALKKTTKVFTGETGATNSGVWIAHDLDATGNFSNARALNTANGHNNKGGAINIPGTSFFVSTAVAGTKVQVRRRDSTGAVAEKLYEIVGTDNQEPKALAMTRGGHPVVLSVQSGSTANNFHVTQVGTDLASQGAPIELSGANRLPAGTAIAGFKIIHWTKDAATSPADYALIAAGGAVNRLYVVNLNTRTFETISLTVGAETLSPEAMSVVRETRIGANRLDLAGRLTGTGTRHSTLIFTMKGGLPTPSTIVGVHGDDQQVVALTTYIDSRGDIDPANDRIIIWVGNKNSTSVSAYNVQGMVPAGSVSVGSLRIVRELIRAPSMNGFVIGYQGQGAGARFASFDGVTQIPVEVSSTPANYSNIAVGHASFSVEKRAGGHEVRFYHVVSGTSANTNFLALGTDPTAPPDDFYLRFLRFGVATQ